MDKAVKVHTTIAKHENLLVLRWEGFKRTASDELYHAVWANTEGVRNFRLPFQSEVVKFNKNALADPYKTVGPSEKGWIAEISVDRHVLELALKNGDVMEEGFLPGNVRRRGRRGRRGGESVVPVRAAVFELCTVP